TEHANKKITSVTGKMERSMTRLPYAQGYQLPWCAVREVRGRIGDLAVAAGGAHSAVQPRSRSRWSPDSSPELPKPPPQSCTFARPPKPRRLGVVLKHRNKLGKPSRFGRASGAMMTWRTALLFATTGALACAMPKASGGGDAGAA